MSDDDSKIKPHEMPDNRYGESLLYDFSKFLITMPVLVLGAMLTLTQAAKIGDIKVGNIIMVVVSLSGAAVFAFHTANALVDARSRGKEPSKNLPLMIKISSALAGLGIGGFLMLWIDTLS